MEHLADRLALIPGVVAVSLGGSRATGQERPDSDWDFGLYYRGRLDPDDVRALGFEGHVAAPGDWGPLMNGGAWLEVDGQRVDLIYRDLEVVEHWLAEAEEGRFQVQLLGGYVAGVPTYFLAGELANQKVLTGSLPRPPFPAALRQTAPGAWRQRAAFSLLHAGFHTRAGAVTQCAGMLARATIEVAHARLAERGEWAINEKRMVRAAGLAEADDLLSGVGARIPDLEWTLERLSMLLGVAAGKG